MLHGLSSLVVAADAAFLPLRHASRLRKSEATGACVTEAVILSTSSSEASTAAAPECGKPRPKRRRVTGKQSPHAASRKALALPGQLPIVETHSSKGAAQCTSDGGICTIDGSVGCKQGKF